MNFLWNRVYGFCIVLLIILFDQISKQYILHFLKNQNIIELTPFLNLVLVFNPGVSFGLFFEYPWLIKVITLILIVCLCVWMLIASRWIEILAVSLILGGAFGNFIDRILYGAVVDFVDFYLGPYHWPAFNVADSSICMGALALLIESFYSGSLFHKSSK